MSLPSRTSDIFYNLYLYVLIKHTSDHRRTKWDISMLTISLVSILFTVAFHSNLAFHSFTMFVFIAENFVAHLCS